MNREEIFSFRNSFKKIEKKFLKIFSKTPPKNPFPFQTSEHIITSDYRFIDKEGEYFAKLIMRAEASKNMMRLFFQLSDGRKIITPVFWWQSYLGFYEIDNGTNLKLIYERNGKGIALKEIEILD